VEIMKSTKESFKFPHRTQKQWKITACMLIVQFMIPIAFCFISLPWQHLIPTIIIAIVQAAYVMITPLSEFNLEIYIFILFFSIPYLSLIGVIVISLICCVGLLFFAIDKIGTFIKEA
jgi:hypothetical protein